MDGLSNVSAGAVGFIVAGLVAVATLVVWLVGLALALRGSAPADRPGILRAFAALRLPGAGRYRPHR